MSYSENVIPECLSPSVHACVCVELDGSGGVPCWICRKKSRKVWKDFGKLGRGVRKIFGMVELGGEDAWEAGRGWGLQAVGRRGSEPYMCKPAFSHGSPIGIRAALQNCRLASFSVSDLIASLRNIIAVTVFQHIVQFVLSMACFSQLDLFLTNHTMEGLLRRARGAGIRAKPGRAALELTISKIQRMLQRLIKLFTCFKWKIIMFVWKCVNHSSAISKQLSFIGIQLVQQHNCRI